MHTACAQLFVSRWCFRVFLELFIHKLWNILLPYSTFTISLLLTLNSLQCYADWHNCFAQAFAWYYTPSTWYYTRCGILYSAYMFFDSKYYTIWILVIKFFILFMLIFDNKRNIKDSEILNINHLLTLINILKNFAGL